MDCIQSQICPWECFVLSFLIEFYSLTVVCLLFFFFTFVHFHQTVSFMKARLNLSGSCYIPSTYHRITVSQNKLSVSSYWMDTWLSKLLLNIREGFTFFFPLVNKLRISIPHRWLRKTEKQSRENTGIRGFLSFQVLTPSPTESGLIS